MPIKKCKCCLEEDKLINLWNEYQCYGDSIIYGNMIKECFSLPFQTPDLEDEFICESCISRLKDAYNFKEQILASDRILRELKHASNQETDSDNELKTEYIDIEYLLDDNCKDLSDALFSDYEEQDDIEEPKQSKETQAKTYKRKDLNSCIKDIEHNNVNTEVAADKFSVPVKIVEKLVRKQERNISKEEKPTQEALNIIMEYSNATPIRNFNGKAYECYFCSRHYEMPADLKNHTLLEHKKNKIKAAKVLQYAAKIDVTDLKCVICHTKVNLITDLCEHLKKEHDKAYDKSALNFLIPLNFKGEQFRCVICWASFEYYKLLYQHMSKHFRNFECDICGCYFKTKWSFWAHKRRHATEEHKCSYCSKVLRTRARLREHINEYHLKKKRNKCVYCAEKFLTLVEKKEHEVAVHGAKKIEFKCQSCDRSYKTRRALTNHTKYYHLMIRSHKCTECDMSFALIRCLKNHMITHTKKKDFVCSVCNKAYGRRCTLREHMRIHLNERRFKCGLCDMSFVQKCSLKSHMASKHPHHTEV